MTAPSAPYPSDTTLPTAPVRIDPAALRPRLSLDGEWFFQFGDEPTRTITVPRPWESFRHELRNRAGTAVYERSFHIPASFVGRRTLLCFGAVDYLTEVWVNDVPVGTHEGGYTPFEFDITEAIRGYGEEVTQTLRVRVTDSTPEQDAVLPDGSSLAFAEIPHGKQSWYTSVGGIWQSVVLEARSSMHIRRATIVPNIDAATASLELTLQGLPDGAVDCNVQVTVTAPEGAGIVAPFHLRIAPEAIWSGETATLRHTFAVRQSLHWSPDTPYLYHAVVVLECNGSVADAIEVRFGMRKIETRQGLVWLNNAPLFLAGALDQDFYPQTIYTPPSEAFLRDQFVKAKEMGLNLMRCHIKVPDPAYLRLCDEIGLLVWYEIPNGARLSPAFRDRAQRTLQAMWERDGNHPCIGIVSLINESWGIDLKEEEQRRWLRDTYVWAKALLPSWLVVDNSPCVPNFHVASDLDDYHVYFSIPDHAKNYAHWVQEFVRREIGSYSSHGDAEFGGDEPIVLSEFGNWGLPRIDNILKAEGAEPYWFHTGSGATRPEGALQRFEEQGLNRVYADYNALSDASQEQQWLSLKWEIEEMRRHSEMAGYVITEFTDIDWECNGLLDMGRNPKVYHSRLKDLQAQDILIPRLSPRTSFWAGQTAVLSVTCSCFSGRSVLGGVVHWHVDGVAELHGKVAVRDDGERGASNVGSYEIATMLITAPPVAAPEKRTIHLELRDEAGGLVARTTQDIVFVPAPLQTWESGLTVWLHDPKMPVSGLADLLAHKGICVVTASEEAEFGLVTQWDATVADFVQGGGRVVLLVADADGIAAECGLDLQVRDRNENGWWGDWCSSRIWFVPQSFPSLPDTARFGFEYQPAIPKYVLTGATSEETLSGLFVGWLQNPASLVVHQTLGQGELVATTFDLLPSIGSDPIATLMLQDLLALLQRS